MRGEKLEAWRVPPVWNALQNGEAVAPPEVSKVLAEQKQLIAATRDALEAVFLDVQIGLRETVGVDCVLEINERCSIVLDLPKEIDAEKIASAIDLENVEAWFDDERRVHVGIGPWFSTKDVDQTVLAPVKVIHVLLGLHATDMQQPKTFGQKILSSIAEIMTLQKKNNR